ncbi:MAG: hypothetical protein JWR70_2133 [Modestobacter sp.]|nr:hypothetical protein [Modestobacter sp.]
MVQLTYRPTGHAPDTGLRGDESPDAEGSGRGRAAETGRFGSPAGIGRVIAVLLSDDAGFVTGRVLPAGGGMTTGDASPASSSADGLAAVVL